MFGKTSVEEQFVSRGALDGRGALLQPSGLRRSGQVKRASGLLMGSVCVGKPGMMED